MTYASDQERIVVHQQKLKLRLPDGGLQLDCGDVLPEVEVAYETYGELAPDRRNAIFVLHALTGDAHAAFFHEGADRPGWWDAVIGPGKAIDTNRYFVICSNVLGGCKGTTGPNSIDPGTGRPYATSFPLVTVADSVRMERLFLEQLGIPELHAVVGGSLGGMRALQWSIDHPDYVKRCVCIASGAYLTPQALAFDIIGREAIESDPHFRDGLYYDAGSQPVRGLSTARRLGHVTYLSANSMVLKFGREERSDPIPGRDSKFSTRFQIESYLEYQGTRFTERFDANTYLYISRMMDIFDLTDTHGTIRRALSKAKARFLIVAISSDWLFPPEQQHDLVSALIANRQPVSFFELDSPYGHDAFLIPSERLSRGLAAFLDAEPAAAPTGTDAHDDWPALRPMVDHGAHVLDIGSGDGSVMLALQRERNVTGLCLDMHFDQVEMCLRKGLPTVQFDADDALDLIADDAFDLVLVNQTIQELRRPHQAMKQLLRIGSTGIVTFPNFAHYRQRIRLLLGGRLPHARSGEQWYDTPIIHPLTLWNFNQLCAREGMEIVQRKCLSEGGVGKVLTMLGMENLGTERVLVKIARPAEIRVNKTSLPRRVHVNG